MPRTPLLIESSKGYMLHASKKVLGPGGLATKFRGKMFCTQPLEICTGGCPCRFACVYGMRWKTDVGAGHAGVFLNLIVYL